MKNWSAKPWKLEALITTRLLQNSIAELVQIIGWQQILNTEICAIYCMKITLNIHSNLLAEAQALAVRQRLIFNSLIEEGLRMRLRASENAIHKTRRAMPVFDGKTGLVLGLNSLSTSELLDAGL